MFRYPTQKPLVRGDREVTSIPQERQKADLLRLLAVSGFVIAALAVITIVASMIVANKIDNYKISNHKQH